MARKRMVTRNDKVTIVTANVCNYATQTFGVEKITLDGVWNGTEKKFRDAIEVALPDGLTFINAISLEEATQLRVMDFVDWLKYSRIATKAEAETAEVGTEAGTEN